jgi:hypothetical protein
MTEITNSSNINPLSKHFRQPAIYITLTSEGQYWRDGTLDLPVNGKIPVYPMTTRDEITLRTPDALIDGTSVVNVIQSCCPNIKDAWAMPSVDVDSTLIAIRIASYGQTMSITSSCPQCGEDHDYDIDVSQSLSDIEMPDYNKLVDVGHQLKVKLRPMTYRQVSQSGNILYEQERLIQALNDPDVTEEIRKAKYDEHIKKMIDIGIANITNCTEYIVTGEGDKVTDQKFIQEYYTNSESAVVKKLQDHLAKFGDIVGIKPVATVCTGCEKNFDISIDFDYASFFGPGS